MSNNSKNKNMSAIGAAAITAGASLLGGLMSSASSKAAQKREFKYNTQLQQQASDLQQANWEKQFNLQNDYNTPEAQRMRLEAAGMNPNLAYGNQWVNGMSPAASAPSSTVGHAGEGAAAWSSAMNNMAQILSQLNVNESVANRNNAEASLFNAQEDATRGKEKRDDTLFPLQWENLRQQNKSIEYDNTRKSLEEYWYPKFRSKEFDLLNENISKVSQEIANMVMLSNKTQAEVDEIRDRIKLSWASFAEQLKLNDSTIDLNDSIIKLNNSKALLNNEEYKDLYNQNLLNYDPQYGYLIEIPSWLPKAELKRVIPNHVRGFIQDIGNKTYVQLSNQYIASLTDTQIDQLRKKLIETSKHMKDYDNKMHAATWWVKTISGFLPFAPGISTESSSTDISGRTVKRKIGL